MRHIKEYNQLFENQQELTQEQKDWLDKCVFGKWWVNPQTGLVDVDRSFQCSGQGPGFNGVRFGHIRKNFNCAESRLSSLDGAPQSVGGDFSCSYNTLTSLEGAPQSVGGDFYCHHNSLTSLEGAPQRVYGNFYCSNNSLTSLEGAPQSVGKDFICNSNQLVSLKGAPKIVDGNFYCSRNPLTSLEGAPQRVGGGYYLIGNTISDAIASGVLERMRDREISLEQAVSELWNEIPEEDKIYLAKHNPDLSPQEKREYEALGRLKTRII
jgi:hypothetical protein